jgi:hypothetical protein
VTTAGLQPAAQRRKQDQRPNRLKSEFVDVARIQIPGGCLPGHSMSWRHFRSFRVSVKLASETAAKGGLNMKMVLVLALLLTLDSCQSPSRFQMPQNGPYHSVADYSP